MAKFRREFGRRQAEIAASLSENLAKLNKTAAFPDHVEQIAVLTRSRIGPFAGGALARAWSAQPNKHRPAAGVASVSYDPVMADTPSVGEIAAADGFSLLRKPARKIRCLD
jgi:hypothetical protein